MATVPPADPAPKDQEWGDEEAPAEEGTPNEVPFGAKIEKMTKDVIARDPVKKGRCSLGTLFWCICFMLGCFFFGFGVNESDVWEIISSIFLVGISFYAITFLGGDPCLMDAFREQLFYIKQENGRFREQNDALQGRLVGLRTISNDLEALSKKLGDTIENTTALLRDMHRYSMLQTISVVVNQFFAADWDGSGHIIGDEAEVFLPQLDSIWALVPNFDWERLLIAVKNNGLTLVQLSVLLHYLCEEDETGCEQELENIINSAPKPPAPPRRAEDVPQAQLEELYEEASMQAAKMPKWLQRAIEEDRKSRDSEALQPCFEFGPIVIWSCLHFTLILCSIAGLTFTIASFVVWEFTNVVVALLGFVLSCGLMAAARLLEVLRTMRVECAKLALENDRLEHSYRDLSKETSKLMKLKKGFQALQSECAGDLSLAKNLIQKSNTNTKMEATSVVMRLFKDADKNNNQTIDPEEAEMFIHNLKLVFGSVTTFSEEKIKSAATGFTAKEMKALVDIIMDDQPRTLATAPAGVPSRI